MHHRVCLPVIGLAAAALLCGSTRVGAQVQAGSDVLLDMDGSVSAGYAGGFSNQGPSSHGITFGGNGNLTGSFHSPQFLSFDLAPFYNQSRNNSNYQSITDSTGVVASANIFGGSHFPGYVNYSRVYNSETNYLIPGIANYKANGNSQTLGVGWSANFKDFPSFTAGYQQGSSDYSLYGTHSDSFTRFHSVFGTAAYTLDGFRLSGGIHYSNAGSQFPQFVAGAPTEKASSDTTTYTFNVSRSVAFGGSTWVNFTRNTSGYDSPGLGTSQTSDIVSGGVALKPTDRLSTQLSGDYNDNLAGSLFQAVNNAGGITPVSLPGEASHSWGLFGGAQYTLFTGMYVAGTLSHRQQLFLGTSYDSTEYSGSANYGHDLLGGQFTAGVTVTHSSFGNNGESLLGFLSNVIYIRRFGLWSVSVSFGYSQNVQTILVAYTSSSYGYSVSASRRLGRLNWTGSATGSKSLLTQVQGSRTFTQGYSTGLSGRWLGASAGYSKSSGTAVYTGTGITPVPIGVPPTVLPSLIFYGGTTYSVGVGSTPTQGLTLNGVYVKSRTNTDKGLLSSSNETEQANVYLRYRFRKVYFTSGYSRLVQGFSASHLPSRMVSTYYFGLSRWFNFF